MCDTPDPRELSLSDLIDHCRRETERYLRGEPSDPRYCYELFCRAIVEGDGPAWDGIFEVYKARLVVHWVRRHPRYKATNESAEDLAARALTRFYLAMPPDKFENFPQGEVSKLLRFLQLCVHSEIMDSLDRPFDPLPEDLPDESIPFMDPADADKFWQFALARCKNEKELRVLQGCFMLGLAPRHVYQEFPKLFKNATDVSVTRDNLLTRLRNDSDTQAWRNHLG